MRNLFVTANIVIPAQDLTWKAVRSSGPGGQNVNKVATKVELTFALDVTESLPEAVKERLRRTAARYINSEGQLVIASQETRTQSQNLSLALSSLASLVRAATVVPKRRRKTRPTHASQVRRVANKQHQALKKQHRQRVSDES